MPTARNAVRSSGAAKIFWPYHGAAMYVTHVSAMSVATNRNGRAGCCHCAIGATVSCDASKTVARPPGACTVRDAERDEHRHECERQHEAATSLRTTETRPPGIVTASATSVNAAPTTAGGTSGTNGANNSTSDFT